MKYLFQLVALAGGEALGRLAAFALTAVIARSYGLDALAVLSVSQALIAYATIGGDGGLNQEATRRLVRGEAESIVVRDAVRSQVTSAAIASLVVTAGVVVYEPRYLTSYLFFLPIPFAYAVSTPYLLDSRGRMVVLGLGRLLMSLGTAGVGLVWILVGLPSWGFGVAYSAGAWATTCWILWRARAPLKSALNAMGVIARRARFRSGIHLGGVALLVHALASLPMIVAGRISPASDLQAMGVVTRIWFVVSAPILMSGTVMLPLFTRASTRTRVLAAVGIAAMYAVGVNLVLHFTMPKLITFLYGEAAGIASSPSSLYVTALIPMGISAVLISNMIARGLERWLPPSYALSIIAFLLWVALRGSGAAMVISSGWLISQASLAFATAIASMLLLRRGKPSTQVRAAANPDSTSRYDSSTAGQE